MKNTIKQVIISDQEVKDCNEFLKFMKQFKEVRVGVKQINSKLVGVPRLYFQVAKKEIRDSIRMNKAKVTYSIMYNSRIDPKYCDILYIKEISISL